MTGHEQRRIADLVQGIYEIHDEVLAQSGGTPGIFNVRQLHAAAARPFATFGRQPLYETPFDQAAALFHSLVKSHPFIDGTKRTAFLSALWFLRQMGREIPQELPHAEVVRFCLAVAEESLRPQQPTHTIPEIANWFRRLLERPDPDSSRRE